jgi:hypothetical protein
MDVALITTYTGTSHATSVGSNYVSLGSGAYQAQVQTTDVARTKFRTAGTFRDLRVRVLSNLRTSATDVRTYKNGVDGTLQVRVPALTTGNYSDPTHTDTVAVGDVWSYRIQRFASGALTFGPRDIRVTWSTASGATHLVAHHNGGTGSATSFIAITGSHNTSTTASATETHVQHKLPIAGTLQHPSLDVVTNTRNGALTYTLRKNAADTAVVISVTAATTGLFEDASNSAAVVATDLVCWSRAVGGASGAAAINSHGITFVPTTADEWWAGGIGASTGNGTLAFAQTAYFAPIGQAESNATEAERQNEVGLDGTSLLSLTTQISSTPNAASTMTLRKNGVDTAIAVSIPQATSGWVTTSGGPVTYDATDLLSVKVVTGGSSSALSWRAVVLNGLSTEHPPLVNAGPDQILTLPTSAVMAGSATDLESDPLTYLWTQTSGPGTATFVDATSLTTGVSFDDHGVYVLRLTADDGTASDYDEMVVVAIRVLTPVLSAQGEALSNVSASATTYYQLGGCTRVGASTLAVNGVIFHAPGVVTQFAAHVASNSRAASTLQVVQNSYPVAGTEIAIGASTTGTFSNTTGYVVLAASDVLAWEITAGAGGVALTIRSLACGYQADGDPVYRYVRANSTSAGSTTREFFFNGQEDSVGAAAVVPQRVRAGVLENLSWVLATNTRDGVCNLALVKNGSNSALVAVALATTTGTFSDTTNQVTVADNDLVSFEKAVVGGTVGSVQEGTSSLDCVPDADNELNLIATGLTLQQSSASTRFMVAAGSNAQFNTTESDSHQVIATAILAIAVEIRLSANTVNGTSTCTLRQNAADTALVASITAATTGWFGDTDPGVQLDALDLIGVEVTTGGASGTLTARTVHTTALLEPPNSAPTVDAGPDQTGISILEVVQLDGTVSDDGYPSPPAAVTLLWTKESGPGTATFSDATVVDPTVTFSLAGTYVLRLTADDSDLTAYDEMTVTVGSAVDPGNTICGDELVLTWIEQTYTDTLDATETRVTSDAPLNDPSSYYSGKKEPRILELPTITRGLSDTQGQWQAGTMRWREAETDRAVRGRLGAATTYPLTRTTDVCRMIRESDWRAQETARLMFIGHRLRNTPAEDLSIEMESGDVIARDLERSGQELQLPQRLFSPEYTPGIPATLIEQPEPIIYGRESDALSALTPPSLIADTTAGGYMDGTYPNHGHAAMPAGPTPPASGTVGFAEGVGSLQPGDVTADTYRFQIAGIDAGGDWGDPTYFNLDAEGSFTITGANKSIVVSWTNPGASTAVTWRVMMGYVASGHVRYVQYREVSGASTSCTFDNMPSAGEIGLGDFSQYGTDCVGTPVAYYHYVVAAVLSDGSTTAVNGTTNRGYARYQGYVRTAQIEVDTATLPVGATHVRVWRVAPGWIPGNATYGYFEAAIATVNADGNVYVNDDWVGTGLTVADPEIEQGAFNITGYYGGEEILPASGLYWHRWFVCGHAVADLEVYLNDVGAYTTPTKLVGEYGVDWLAPGKTGYTTYVSATEYRDFNGRRYTIVYGRGSTADALATGTGTIRVNVSGVEDVGDASGTLLTEPHAQFKHWFVNFFLQDYQSGAWLATPTWDPVAGWDKVNTSSWDDAAAAAAVDFGAALTGGGVIAELAAKRDWLSRWLISLGLRIGINAGGQWTVVRHDPDTAVAAATYTEARHIVAGSLSFEPLHEEHWTRLPYTFHRDGDGNWSEGEVFDLDAEDDYDEEREGPAHALYFIKSAAVAAFVMEATLDRHKTLPWRVSFDTINLCGSNTDLGDVIGLTHTAGLHVDGWEDFLVMVEGHVTSPTTQTVRLVGRTNIAPHE